MLEGLASEALGIDLGGTKISAFRVAEDGSVSARQTVETPADDSEAIFEAVVASAKEVSGGEVVAVGIGAAGMIDFRAGVLRYAPNLAWRDFPVVERVSKALGLPCLVDNDANVAAWGEYKFGAGVGSKHMLLVTVGTGIGGGIVDGGRMFRGAHGFAAEIGHIIVEPGGPPCGCGNLGCWEQVASGSAITRMGRNAVRSHAKSLLAEMAENDVSKVTGAMVTEAAKKGDPVSVEIIATAAQRLGEGIAGLVNVLDPEIVVVGGGVIAAGDMLLGPARVAFVDSVEASDFRPKVQLVAAKLGNDAGGIGAAAMALEELAG
ncbi:MAG: ROK family glucokinase [Actinomycetota bacterium]